MASTLILRLVCGARRAKGLRMQPGRTRDSSVRQHSSAMESSFLQLVN